MDQEIRDKLKPMFDELITNSSSISLAEIASEAGISYGTSLNLFSQYIRKRTIEIKGDPEVIKVVFLTPDGHIQTYNGSNKLVDRLSGNYSKNLHDSIKAAADGNTKWNGFE